MPLLFSYGSLQEEAVQLSTFGRPLDGQPDELPRFEQSIIAGGHANVTFTGNDESRVPGVVFEITDAELAMADRYEAVYFYKRVDVVLASGRRVWLYVHA